MKYGQRIVWTEFGGREVTCVDISFCDTPDEALNAAVKSATAMGWTPPKWWQWWRWDDTRLPNQGKGK